MLETWGDIGNKSRTCSSRNNHHRCNSSCDKTGETQEATCTKCLPVSVLRIVPEDGSLCEVHMSVMMFSKQQTQFFAHNFKSLVTLSHAYAYLLKKSLEYWELLCLFAPLFFPIPLSKMQAARENQGLCFVLPVNSSPWKSPWNMADSYCVKNK